MSFGYKYGIPLEADLVFDVRFLPNPFYVPELKHKTGMDSEVYNYVFSFPQTPSSSSSFSALPNSSMRSASSWLVPAFSIISSYSGLE